MSTSSQKEAERWREAMIALADETGMPYREIDRRAGWSPNYFSQIKRKTVRVLTVQHVVEFVTAIGMSPRVFFERLYPTHGARPALETTERRVDEEAMTEFHQLLTGFVEQTGEITKRLAERLEKTHRRPDAESEAEERKEAGYAT